MAGGEVERGVAGVVLAQQIFRRKDGSRHLVEVAVFGGEMERGVARGVGPREALGGEVAGEAPFAGGGVQVDVDHASNRQKTVSGNDVQTKS
jgi:hypothetical protein